MPQFSILILENMPLYDYGCPSCGNEQEVQHSMSEVGKIVVKCPKCGAQMRKLLSAPTLIGFDEVGRSISKKDKAEGAKKETTDSTSSKKESTDSKPAKKESAKKDAA